MAALIVGLMVFAYPVLVQVSAKAARAKCATNIGRVGSAILIWAAENNGRLPAYGYIGNNTSQTPTWGMKVAPLLGIDLSKKGQRTVFMCPADQTYKTAQGQNMHKNHVGHNSYAVNVELMDWEEGNSALGGPARGGDPIGTITDPARTILLAECHVENNVISWGAGNGKTWRPGYSYEYTVRNGDEQTDPGKRGYHQGQNNWFFADGHVEALSFRETLSPPQPLASHQVIFYEDFTESANRNVSSGVHVPPACRH